MYLQSIIVIIARYYIYLHFDIGYINVYYTVSRTGKMSKIMDYYARKKLIADRDGGLTHSALKDKYGITDDRTLKKHLMLAEQEEEARAVKFSILKDALTGHLNEIRALIEQLQSTVKVPLIYEIFANTVAKRDSLESNELFSAIKAHIPAPALWRNYATWNDQLQEFVTEYEQLKIAIQKEAADWLVRRVVTETFSIPVERRLHDKLMGQKITIHQFNTGYNRETMQRKPGKEYEILAVDGFAIVEADDVSSYRDQYQSLSDHFIDSAEADKLVSQYKALNDEGNKIDKSIRMILRRRDYIIYQCKWCPAQIG